MAFSLFKKYCPVCGTVADKSKNITRFGKHFCSDEHAEQFVRAKEEYEKQAQKRASSGGGCCGH